MPLNTEIERTENWIQKVHLDTDGLARKQVMKNLEEAAEVVGAFIETQNARDADEYAEKMEALVLEIGDNLVTLIVLCQQLGLDLSDCLSKANDKIYTRIGTGRMVDGKFVKMEDLPCEF